MISWKQNKDETHCNFDEYVSLFDYAKGSKNFNMILSEKTPSYFRYYHTCYSLSFYAHIYDISFYVFLRNPIKRTWSIYWMYAKMHHQGTNRSNLIDIHTMNDKIQNDIDMFSQNYPLFQQLLSMMTDQNGTLDEFQLVQLYVRAAYDPYSKFDIPFLISSCYYPQLLMWLYTFDHIIPKDWNITKTVKFHDRFKIIQSETMLRDPKKTMKEFLCWMMKNDDRKCNDIQNILNSPSVTFGNGLFSKKSTRTKVMSYSPNIVDVMDLSVSNSLHNLYQSCNQRLYDFLQNHNELLLPNSPFPSW